MLSAASDGCNRAPTHPGEGRRVSKGENPPCVLQGWWECCGAGTPEQCRPYTARAHACWSGSAEFLLQRNLSNNRFQEEPWVFLPGVTTQEGQGSKSYKVALAVVIIAMTTHGLLEGMTVASLLSSACCFS